MIFSPCRIGRVKQLCLWRLSSDLQSEMIGSPKNITESPHKSASVHLIATRALLSYKCQALLLNISRLCQFECGQQLKYRHMLALVCDHNEEHPCQCGSWKI